jgi:3-deoxy-D-manno-octulosonate 8-phosphate phosphatase KdsC-like HAD superfamily phosphatase
MSASQEHSSDISEDSGVSPSGTLNVSARWHNPRMVKQGNIDEGRFVRALKANDIETAIILITGIQTEMIRDRLLEEYPVSFY